MLEIIRVSDDTTVEQLLAELHRLSAWPQSEQRTVSTDTLLDLVNAWAGA